MESGSARLSASSAVPCLMIAYDLEQLGHSLNAKVRVYIRAIFTVGQKHGWTSRVSCELNVINVIPDA